MTSTLTAPDPAMAAYIDEVRAPYAAKLAEQLAVTEGLLYRRGNFNGTFDELLLRALTSEQDAEISGAADGHGSLIQPAARIA